MRDRRANLIGNVTGSQQSPLLMAGGAGATLLARESDKHLMVAVRTANSCKAFLQIATLHKSCHAALDDWPPVTILGLKAFVVDVLKDLKVLVNQTPQIRRVWIA